MVSQRNRNYLLKSLTVLGQNHPNTSFFLLLLLLRVISPSPGVTLFNKGVVVSPLAWIGIIQFFVMGGPDHVRSEAMASLTGVPFSSISRIIRMVEGTDTPCWLRDSFLKKNTRVTSSKSSS